MRFGRFVPFWVWVGLLACFACENDPAEIRELAANYDTSVERATDVEILYSDSAQVRVKIQGPTMLYHASRGEKRQEFPDGVIVDFFGQGQQITSTLTAKRATRYENKQQVIVQDSVVWRSIEKEKLESEELIWDEKTQRVFTQKFVVITRPDEIIYGHGFEANQDFSYSKINAIEGRLKVENDGTE